MTQRRQKKTVMNDTLQAYKGYLKKKSMFFTRERQVILESILEQPDHFSADELVFELQKTNKKVSRATVYRCLHQLSDAGLLIEADFGHGHAHYEVALGDPNHIHLINTVSGDVTEVYSEELEKLLEKITRKNGFALKQHKIQLFVEPK